MDVAHGLGLVFVCAQTVMVSNCLRAGFTSDQLLTEEGALPTAGQPSIVVATDDVHSLTRASDADLAAGPPKPLKALDAEWTRQGLKSQYDKAYDLRHDATILGIELRQGTHLLPKGARLWDLLEATSDLAANPQASASEVASYAGVLHWHDLLARPLYSCLHRLYRFIEPRKDTTLRRVPTAVISELLHNTALHACWVIDLTRPWLPVLPMADASTSFGFGCTMASLAPSAVRQIADEAGRCGAHFRPLDLLPGATWKDRRGKCCMLPRRQRDFKHVFSVRAKYPGTPGALEASAVVLLLKRLSLKPRWFGHRGVALGDAQAVQSALHKGRTSAPTLRRPIRRAGAMMLACDWRYRHPYCPFESNSADPSSRGRRNRGAMRRQEPSLARLIRRLQAANQAWRQLNRGPYGESDHEPGSSESCSSLTQFSVRGGSTSG